MTAAEGTVAVTCHRHIQTWALDDSPFRRAKASFLAALYDQHRLLPTLTPAFPSSPRRVVRTEVDELVSSLDDLENELNDVQREIQKVRNSLSQQKTAAMMSLQPIGMLPPEMIRKIVFHAVEGPHDYLQIARLLQVSKLWRDVVLDISSLFSQANWAKWPISQVEMWCSRAKPHLLTIYMCDTLLRMLGSAYGGPRRELLRKVAAQIGHLDIFCDNHSNPSLLDMQMPSLKLLNIRNADSAHGEFRIQSENVPMLRVLKLTMSKPKFLTPLTSVTHFHYYNLLYVLPKSGTQIFSKLPNLQHLALTLLAFPAPRSSMPRIALPLLTSLELEWKTSRMSIRVYSFSIFLNFQIFKHLCCTMTTQSNSTRLSYNHWYEHERRKDAILLY